MNSLLRYKWLAVALLVVALTGCPQMFVYVPEGAESLLPSQNPETSTPGVAARPVLSTVSVLGGDPAPISADVASYSTDQLISLSSETEGASIYYTLNGTNPDPYAGEVLLFDPATPISAAAGDGTSLQIKAIALAPQMYPSEVTAAQVDIAYNRVSTPGISPAAGTINGDFQITLTNQDGGDIWYRMSTNGTEPPDPSAGSGTLYTGPISVSGNGAQRWIKAMAVKEQMLDSFIAQAQYQIQYPTAATPVLNPATGSVAHGSTVTITTATPGAQIWYLRSTTGPIAEDPAPQTGLEYTGPITLLATDGQLWIKAVAAKDQLLTSAVATGNYSIYPLTPTGLSVTNPTTNSLDVAWNDSTGATGFRLYRDTSSGGTFATLVYDGPLMGITDDNGGAGLVGATTYYYKVLAYNDYVSSPSSAVASGATSIVPPATLTALDGAFTDRVRVSWSSIPSAVSYDVYRATTAGGPYSFRQTVAGTLYDDTGVTLNSIYYYVVRAFDGAATSGDSPFDSGYSTTNLVLSGPTLDQNVDLWANSGLQFRALQNRTLTRFTFHNQGAADTITLTNVDTGGVVGTYTAQAGDPAQIITVSWALTAGTTYRLTSAAASNGRWTNYASYPTANADIAVDGTWGNGALQQNFWFTFRDLNTGP